jgi:mannan endo-1,6-alpha-mannosidase
MSEVSCENVNGVGNCDTDQLSFKAYLSRYLAVTSQLAPFTSSTITPLLSTSATAAVKQCVGGTSGTTCGYHWAWNNGTYDGSTGVGQQMSALSVVQSLLIPKGKVLVTNSTGGTSTGNVNAGQGSNGGSAMVITPATMGDRAGAGILTTIVLVVMLGGVGFMVSGP